MVRLGLAVLLAVCLAGGCATAGSQDDVTDAGAGGGPGARGDLHMITPCPGHDVLTDPKNCGGCNRVCAGEHVAANGCRAGACVVGTCDPNFYDVDGKPGNGCECKQEMGETPQTATCAGARAITAINTTSHTKVEIVGNLVPLGDEDWYLIRAMDEVVADGVCDKFDLKIAFIENPMDEARFDAFDDCGMPTGCGPNEKPRGLTSYEWNSNGAKDEGACNCYMMDPPDGGGHICMDASRVVRIRVYRDASKPYTCDNYKLLVTNGL